MLPFSRGLARSFTRAYATTPSTDFKISLDAIKQQHAQDIARESPDALGLETYEQVEAKIADEKENFLSCYNAYQRYLNRLDLEDAGPVDPQNFSIFNKMTRQPFTVDQFFDFIKDTEHNPETWTVDQVEEYLFTPLPHPFNVQLYCENIAAYRTLRKLGVRGPKQRELTEKYNVSCGEVTLEWLLPSPAPFHTYEEACIIKEPPSFTEEDE